jgi:hypothetical protein
MLLHDDVAGQHGPDLVLEFQRAALEAVLNATPRGRWFLAEYARRNRSVEAGLLLGAIAKLEAAVVKQQQMPPCDVFGELVEMSKAIAHTRREIAEIKPPHQFDKQLIGATEELDHKLVEALYFIEQRINAMIEIWAVDDIAFGVEDGTAKMEAPAEASAVYASFRNKIKELGREREDFESAP